MQSFKTVLDCLTKNVTQNIHAGQTILAEIGMSALYVSNCSKDIGMVFLLLDNIVAQVRSAQPKWVNIVVETFAEYMAGQTGYGDCKAAYEYIVGLFRK
jgi:hypothetical protein